MHCQAEIELEDKCDIQCEHCKIYYRPLELDRAFSELPENRKALIKKIFDIIPSYFDAEQALQINELLNES